ncbi:MAG: agmatine deiminase family protein [Bryobacterales bacterium]|nr:agmatine deiminase family protein [Bryobacteraceae bacterium]MDW8131475.1 agmatine deiminase family protein [Bryobacterales bacterium]
MSPARPTPAALGFRLPAEWEPHAATWIAWPHNRTDWPGKFAPIPWIYCEIVRHLATSETVCILVQDRRCEETARRLLERSHTPLEKVIFFRQPTNRGWTRDYAPLFLTSPDGQLAAVKFRFNAWARYRDWPLDDAAGDFIARHATRRVWRPALARRRIVLEGGALETDGRGLLLTTEECLLGTVQARNPGLSREAIEEVLHDYLGVEKVLWLGAGIAGDDTHGHVDDVARFVAPSTVVAAVESEAADPNYAPLRENWRRLRRMRDLAGRPLRLVPLPMPRPVLFGGQRLPASYANFYVANRVVLVPVFGDPHDRIALGILARIFPQRQVVGIYARDLVLGLGTLHCLTMQQPSAGS